jgi:hypothetical protein
MDFFCIDPAPGVSMLLASKSSRFRKLEEQEVMLSAKTDSLCAVVTVISGHLKSHSQAERSRRRRDVTSGKYIAVTDKMSLYSTAYEHRLCVDCS